MIGVVIGGVSFVAIPLLLGWLLVTGLSRGRIRARFVSYSRADEPISFWTTAATYAGLIIFWVAIVAWAILATLPRR
jgi:hypothetical protein